MSGHSQKQKYWSFVSLLVILGAQLVREKSQLGETTTRTDRLVFFDEEDEEWAYSEVHQEVAAAPATAVSVDNSDERHQKYLILHVGPPKTGTTSIQCSLRDETMPANHNLFVLETQECRPSPNKLKLLQDKYRAEKNKTLTVIDGGPSTYDNVLLGAAFVPSCLRNWNSTLNGMPSCWNESFAKVMAEQPDKNFIISQENLCMLARKITRPEDQAKFVRDLSHSLEVTTGHTLWVVVTYRRWFDWVLSRHNQGNKGKLGSGWPPKTENQRFLPIQDIQQVALRTERFFPMESRADELVTFFSQQHNNNNDHPPIPVRLINYHDSKDITRSFYCDALPEALAERLCAWASRKVMKEGSSASSSSVARHNQASLDLRLDKVGITARSQGWMSNKKAIGRKRIVELLQEFFRDWPDAIVDETKEDSSSGQQQHTNYTGSLLLRCPDDAFYQSVLNTSLAYEDLTFVYKGAEYRERERQQHMEQFAASKTKYCEIAPHLMYQNNRAFAEFLRSI